MDEENISNSEPESLEKIVNDNSLLNESILVVVEYMTSTLNTSSRYRGDIIFLDNCYNTDIFSVDEAIPMIKRETLNYFNLSKRQPYDDNRGCLRKTTPLGHMFNGLLIGGGAALMFGNYNFLAFGIAYGVAFGGNQKFWDWYDSRKETPTQTTKSRYDILSNFSDDEWKSAVYKLEDKLKKIISEY